MKVMIVKEVMTGDVSPVAMFIRVCHFRHKLFEMVGTAWILDLLNISDHFAF